MRKLLFSILAVLFMASSAIAATPGYKQDPGAGDILGQGKYQSDAHKIFRMVRYTPATYDGATTLAANSIVVWDTGNDDGVSVDTTTTSSDSAVAGIIATQALTPDADSLSASQAVGDKNWTWLQTYGYTTVNLSTASGLVAGDAFATSTTAGEIVGHSANSNDPAAQGIAGFAYDAATAGDNSVEVFLKGLD